MLLIMTLSFSIALPNIVLGVASLAYVFLLYKKKIVVPEKQYYYTFGLFFLYFLLKSIFSSSINDEARMFSRLLVVIILPIVFIPIHKNKIILGFIASVLTAALITLIHITIYCIQNKTLVFSYDANIVQHMPMMRPYLGFMCLIAFILCLFMAKEEPKYKKTFIALSIFLGVFIFFIVARLSIITLLGVVVIYVLFYSGLSFTKKAILITVGFLALSTALVYYKNLSTRYETLKSSKTVQDSDPRLVIWECALKIPKSPEFSMIFGGKSCKWVKDQTIQCYSDSIADEGLRNSFITERFDSHNQFIESFLYGGFIGLGVFLFFLFSMMKNSIGNFYFFSIVVSLIVFFLMENVLTGGQFGPYLIAIIFSITTQYKEDKKLKSPLHPNQ